jgi:hypothetical protein
MRISLHTFPVIDVENLIILKMASWKENSISTVPAEVERN